MKRKSEIALGASLATEQFFWIYSSKKIIVHYYHAIKYSYENSAVQHFLTIFPNVLADHLSDTHFYQFIRTQMIVPGRTMALVVIYNASNT